MARGSGTPSAEALRNRRPSPVRPRTLTPAAVKAVSPPVIVIEINKEGEDALLIRRDVGQRVAMLAVLLAGGVAQHLQRFAGADVSAAGGGEAAVERVDRRVLVDQGKGCGA